MNNPWTSIPTIVRRSRILTADEKDLYYEITDRLNVCGYCTDTNKVLSEALNVSERTISDRLSNMQKKHIVGITQNYHKHERRIYLNVPRGTKPFLEEKPTNEELNEKTRLLKESMKKAIVLGSLDFEFLVEKLIESPCLDNMKDNSTQFAVNEEQFEFLAEMKRLKKKIDCQIALYPGINYQELINAINKSNFLAGSSNLNMKWLLENSDKILNGDYKNSCFTEQQSQPNKNFKGREYTLEEYANLFQKIDDIVV